MTKLSLYSNQPTSLYGPIRILCAETNKLLEIICLVNTWMQVTCVKTIVFMFPSK